MDGPLRPQAAYPWVVPSRISIVASLWEPLGRRRVRPDAGGSAGRRAVGRPDVL